MSITEAFIGFFKISEADKGIIRHDILNENIRRTFYLSLIAIPISLIHVILFGLQLPHSNGVEYKWRFSIFLIHLSISVILLAISVIVYFSFIQKRRNYQLAKFGLGVVMVMLLVGGSLISAVDQLVTSAINPFIATSLIYAIVLLVRPLYSVFYYLGSFLVFYFLMSYMQTNPDILTSIKVNGLTFTGLGLCLSFIFWKMYLTRIKQHKLIEEQKNEIIENYNKLKFYSEELKESNTTKDKLISVIAHDLRSPLASLINVTKLLSEEMDIMSPDEAKNVMLTLNKETELTFESLNNLLLWAKNQRGTLNPIPEDIQINELFRSTFLSIESLFKQKKIAFFLNIDEKFVARADYSMIQSVVKNLLINGIKFTSDGGLISCDASLENEMITISVRDTGIGIKPEILEKLFIPGNEITTQGTQREKGTGLGLQISKEFVELNGGRIWAESELSRGSTFYFTLSSSKY